MRVCPSNPRRRVDRLVATVIGEIAVPARTNHALPSLNVEANLEDLAVENRVILTFDTKFTDIFGLGP